MRAWQCTLQFELPVRTEPAALLEALNPPLQFPPFRHFLDLRLTSSLDSAGDSIVAGMDKYGAKTTSRKEAKGLGAKEWEISTDGSEG